ncbi:MAG: slipin family protein [Candidatus Micrarchaeota archaeon]|nr:slipin family protein [Candidatus Micrarchaeota archaeon]
MGRVNPIQLLVFVVLLIVGTVLVFFTKDVKLIAVGILLLVYTLAGIRIIYQYEKGVLFVLGRYQGLLEPGFVWFAPIIQSLVKIDLRIQTIDLPKQEVITKDNVPVKINATVFFKVQFPDKSVLNVEDYKYATMMYSQTVLRDVIGGVELDGLLEKRDEIAESIRKIVDEITDEWGIDVTGVRLQDIELPEEMRRAMARQAEAERERRAVIIKSEGEIKAAENLTKAGKMIGKTPEALHLRTLHTLAEISSDPNQKFVILLPVELLKAFMKKKEK